LKGLKQGFFLDLSLSKRNTTKVLVSICGFYIFREKENKKK